MQSYDPSVPLFSIHVPKCAGRSFALVLREWFRSRLNFHYHDERHDRAPKRVRLTGLLTKRPRSDICIHGHFNRGRGEGVFDYYPDARQIITIVRDPFDAHVSRYFYVRTKTGGVFHKGQLHPILEQNLDLEAYLQRYRNSNFANFFPPVTVDSCHDVLSAHFSFIGIAENLQESVIELAKWLDKPAPTIPRINESIWDEEVPDGAREEFYNVNPLAKAIYDYARELNNLPTS